MFILMLVSRSCCYRCLFVGVRRGHDSLYPPLSLPLCCVVSSFVDPGTRVHVLSLLFGLDVNVASENVRATTL